MTVCVAIKVNDCIVFAADSASTLIAQGNNQEIKVLNVYNNADKVFNLHRKLPLVGMTAGMGHIGKQSISNLSKELRHELQYGENPLDELNYSVDEVVQRAYDFLNRRYQATLQDPFGGGDLEFWIGGYGPTHSLGEIWTIQFSGGQALEPIRQCDAEDDVGVFWGGQGEGIARLLIGIDPAFVEVMVAGGANLQAVNSVYQQARSRLETQMVAASMPVLDAIRLADFLVETTKGYFSFKFGSDTVGGATDIATITKWEGFKWIKRKHFYPADLNWKDLDHVR